MDLKQYREKIANLNANEQILRDLYLRKLSLGEFQGPLTGYPSLDKTWLRYYSEEHINAEIPNMTAYEYLKKLNENNLDGIAFDSIEDVYTYKDLFQIIDDVAASLYKMGTEKGKKILIMLPALPHESFLLYGADKIGAAVSYLHPQSTSEEIIEAIDEFDVDLFFTFDYLLNKKLEKEIYAKTKLKNIISIPFELRKIDDDKKTISWNQFLVKTFSTLKNMFYNKKTISWNKFILNGVGVDVPKVDRDPKDLLFIAKTGGSTGKPKSVLLNDNSFNIAVHQYLNSDLKYDANDRWLRLWPLFSATAAVSNNHLPLCAGMNNIIRQFPLNILDFDKMFDKEKPEHLLLIPQLLDVLEQSELLKDKDLSYVKTSGCGGMAITGQFEERVNEFHKSHNMDCFLGYGWGCTENATSAAMRSNYETTSIGTVGAPLVNTTVSVFEPSDLSEKRYDEEGELCIKSYTQMLGYYNDPKLTNEVLKMHEDGCLWLHTGDLGSISKDGIVTVKGRMTRTIFAFPMAKIYPSALEDVISKVAGVREVVVGELPDYEHEGFGVPVCFIVPDENASNEEIENNINIICETTLPEHYRPKNIKFMEMLPRTTGDKPDVKRLESELTEEISLIKQKKLNM